MPDELFEAAGSFGAKLLFRIRDDQSACQVFRVGLKILGVIKVQSLGAGKENNLVVQSILSSPKKSLLTF